MPNKALTIDVNPAAIPSGLVDNWSPLGMFRFRKMDL